MAAVPEGDARRRSLGASSRIDPGRVLVDPGIVITERPGVDVVPEMLRDRAERLRIPEPPRRLKPGTLVDPVTIEPKELSRMLRGAATDDQVIWSRAGSEILIVAKKVSVETTEGGVVVTVPIQTEETGAIEIQVPIALGTADRDAGLLASTSARPLGPAIIVDRWGDAIVAFAWQALLTVAIAIAAKTGADSRGDPLVPASLRSSEAGLIVVAIARHRTGG